MPLNAVHTHVLGLLNGLAIPGLLTPDNTPQQLDAYIVPPAVEALDRPKGYVYGGRMRGKRRTVPRGQGFKRLDWMVDVFLTYQTALDTATVDNEFALIIDAVLWAMWTAEMPVQITDPTTGRKSTILSIGEDFELENPPERVPHNLQLATFMARVGLSVTEDVQA